MSTGAEALKERINDTRYRGQSAGYYESFFVRANHPSRPLAFWIRYTLTSPRNYPERAVGELWTVFFNGETGAHVAAKRVVPLRDCTFSTSGLEVTLADAHLDANSLHGATSTPDAAMSFDLRYTSDSPPLLLLPTDLYDTSIPSAKSAVAAPLATFDGVIVVNGDTILVEQWVGSQNHNWGTRHTDRYAWGQVAGFDTHPDSFLEMATAQVRIGPIWSPRLTLLVLRHAGQEWSLNTVFQSWRATGAFGIGRWAFRSRTKDLAVGGEVTAPRSAFVGLAYLNPAGGTKHCLNTKIASCVLTIERRDRGKWHRETLRTAHRAAFEVLTDDDQHGIRIRA